MRLTAFSRLVFCVTLGASVCSACDGATPAAKATLLPLLTAFQEYVERFPKLPVGPREVATTMTRPDVLQILWYEPDSLVAVLQPGLKPVWERYDLASGKTSKLKAECSYPRWTHIIPVRSGKTFRLFWLGYLGRTPRIKCCEVCADGTVKDVLPLPPVGNPAPIVGVVMHSEEGIMGWWGHFAWLDASGKVVIEGDLPAPMRFNYSSPLALRRHGKIALWALELQSPDPRGYASAEDRTDITILKVQDGECSVVETIKFDDIPIPIRVDKGWRIDNTLDSPAWLPGDRNVLVYRHVWEIETSAEWLSVLEIWAKEPGKKARMLDMFARYAGTAGAFFYETDAYGKLQERYEDRDKWISSDDLAPFPAFTGSKVAYLRRSTIMTLEVGR